MSARIFIGIDPRQPVAYNVLQFSILRRARKPVQIIPLVLPQLPMKRRGLTEFTYSRFLVPYLCNYAGYALFLDADMLVRADIHGLFDLVADSNPASVYVVKNRQRFEWPSLMLYNCAMCRPLTPEYIDNQAHGLFDFEWAFDGEAGIGALPPEWNHCVGYDAPNPDAKVVHFTQGIPCFAETKDCEHAQEWRDEQKAINGTVAWAEIMGNSVHAPRVIRPAAPNIPGMQVCG